MSGGRKIGLTVELRSVIVTRIKTKLSRNRYCMKGGDSSNLWEGEERWYKLDKGRRCQAAGKVFYIHIDGVD